MPPSRLVEGMEKVFLCDNEEEKKNALYLDQRLAKATTYQKL